MMFDDQHAKTYAVHALAKLGISVPRYERLLSVTPSNRTIDGLQPWAFDHAPEKAIGFCSEALGREVLPFAQAVGEDMMACFEAEPQRLPAVVVINPWAEDKADIVLAELPDFDAWLRFAQQVSEAVQARERDEAGED